MDDRRWTMDDCTMDLTACRLPSDLFLSPDLTEEQARAYLQSLGFRDAAAVDEHFQRMADDLAVREALGRLAPDLLPAVLESPDPDAAVAAIAQYVASRSGRAMFLDYLREDPRALHVLTYVMGASPHLGEILIRTPGIFSLAGRAGRAERARSAGSRRGARVGVCDDRRSRRRAQHASALEAPRDAAHRHARSASPRNRADRGGAAVGCRVGCRRFRARHRHAADGSMPRRGRNRPAPSPSSAPATSVGEK